MSEFIEWILVMAVWEYCEKKAAFKKGRRS